MHYPQNMSLPILSSSCKSSVLAPGKPLQQKKGISLLRANPSSRICSGNINFSE